MTSPSADLALECASVICTQGHAASCKWQSAAVKGPSEGNKKSRAGSQRVKSGRDEAGALRRGSEVIHWLDPGNEDALVHTRHPPTWPSRARGAHWYWSTALADCAATPTPLMKGADWPSSERWEARPTESSMRGDGNVIALIKWLWLAGSHRRSAIVPRVNHNEPVRADNQEAPRW